MPDSSGLELKRLMNERNKETKIMKHLYNIALAILYFALSMQSHAHTLAETNEIVRIMLGVATAFSDYPSGGRHLRRRLNYQDPNVFFDAAHFGHGWTSDGLRAAFDYFLEHMHEGDYSVGSGTTPYWPAMAVMQCGDLNYTNAVPAIRRLVSNATYPSRNRIRAVSTTIELSGVNDETTAFVESIMTNSEVYVRSERFMACWTYIKQVQASEATNEVQVLSRNRALSMLYRNRLTDLTDNAFYLDDLFCSRLDGYSVSSNRLELATHVLSAADCWQATRDRFISVTNQLLSSGQPLPWINFGGGGN